MVVSETFYTARKQAISDILFLTYQNMLVTIDIQQYF